MEARYPRVALLATIVCLMGAGYRTTNFVINAPTPQMAKEIGDSAERFRRDLAIEWLGRELPRWSEPCPVTAHVSPNMGAGGATSFYFDRGRPFGWRMTIQGSRERLLDSVLPHEVTHTIFATHFGGPLPRWADEGACTTVEHASEQQRQKQMLVTFLTTGRGIAFNRMYAMKEYPSDILPLYAQGFSLARYLIAQGGKRKFIEYVGDGMRGENWTAATQKHYGIKNLSQLQVTWLDWVRQGSPALRPSPVAANQELLAAVDLTPPASKQTELSENSSQVGWYQQQGEIARRQRGTVAVAKRDDRRSRAIEQSTTRPQPLQQPRQIILETRVAPTPYRTIPVPDARRQPIYGAPLTGSGTVWR